MRLYLRLYLSYLLNHSFSMMNLVDYFLLFSHSVMISLLMCYYSFLRLVHLHQNIIFLVIRRLIIKHSQFIPFPNNISSLLFELKSNYCLYYQYQDQKMPPSMGIFCICFFTLCPRRKTKTTHTSR